MSEINFHELGVEVFQNVCQKLVSAQLTEQLERTIDVKRFGEGPDGGVDLLCDDSPILYVWQCKRYENAAKLLSSLARKGTARSPVTPEWEKMHTLMAQRGIPIRNLRYVHSLGAIHMHESSSADSLQILPGRQLPALSRQRSAIEKHGHVWRSTTER